MSLVSPRRLVSRLNGLTCQSHRMGTGRHFANLSVATDHQRMLVEGWMGKAKPNDPYMKKFAREAQTGPRYEVGEIGGPSSLSEMDISMLPLASLAKQEPDKAHEWPALIDRMRRGRLQRLRQQMKKQNMAAVVLLDPQNIRYATDARNMSLWHMRNPVRYCLVPQEGPVILFESLYGDPVLTLGLPTIDEIRTPVGVCMGNAGARLPEMAIEWAKQMRDVLLPITKQMGTRKVGIERFNVRCMDALLSYGEFDLVDAEEATVPARAVKLPEEVEVVRRGVKIVEKAVNKMRNAVRPGMTENELWSVMHQGVISQDCEWVETRLLSSGPRTNPWYQECCERVIQEGELIALDTDVYGPGGYFIDLSRTFLCGDKPPTDQQRTNYQLATEMMEYNREVLKPGLTFKQFSEKAWKLPDPYVKNSYLISLHGNGVAGEYPLIYHPHMFDEWGYDGLIEEGMMVSFEAFIGHEDGGEGVKLEQHALVTATGTEILSTGVPFEDNLLASAPILPQRSKSKQTLPTVD